MIPNIRYTYSHYVNNYDQAMKTLTWAQENSEEFSKFLNGQRNHPVHGCLSLPSLLIGPVQRLPKYEMLLRALLKHVPFESPIKNQLLKVVSDMKDVVTFVNENKRTTDNLVKMITLQEKVNGLPKNLFRIPTQRTWIMEDEVKCCKGRVNASKKYKPKRLILLTNILLVCKPKGENLYYKMQG